MIINKKYRVCRTDFERLLVTLQITPAQAAEALGVKLVLVYAWCRGDRIVKDFEEKKEILIETFRGGRD